VASLAISAREPSLVEGRAELIEVLKGASTGSIQVNGYAPSVDCWAAIDVGREYVVFLPNAAGQADVWFSAYSKTIPVKDVPAALLQTWRSKE
jgi:hypothetical protein